MKDVDLKKIYGVEDYLSSLCLSVKPIYKGQKIGRHLLSARFVEFFL